MIESTQTSLLFPQKLSRFETVFINWLTIHERYMNHLEKKYRLGSDSDEQEHVFGLLEDRRRTFHQLDSSGLSQEERIDALVFFENYDNELKIRLENLKKNMRGDLVQAHKTKQVLNAYKQA